MHDILVNSPKLFVHQWQKIHAFVYVFWKISFTINWYFMLPIVVESYMNCLAPTSILNCVSWTPFGKPVVPDEHKIIATFSFIFCGWHLNLFKLDGSSDAIIVLYDIVFVFSLALVFESAYLMICWTNLFLWATAMTLFKYGGETNMIFGFDKLIAWFISSKFTIGWRMISIICVNLSIES